MGLNDVKDGLAVADLSVFERIPSQTSEADRRCLLKIQTLLRRQGEYVYLEIGSHLGGTLQPHYAAAECRRLYSIDKRPDSQPDERGERYHYPKNSTQAMRDNLKRAFPDAEEGRLVTFDSDAADVEPGLVRESADLCFVDGEHTNAALVSDMRFCLKVVKTDGVICTHDSGVVGEGILAMKRELGERGVAFSGMKPGGSIYVFALGRSAERLRQALAGELQDEGLYFRSAAFYRRRLRREAALRKYPVLLAAWRAFTRAKDGLYAAYSMCRHSREPG